MLAALQLIIIGIFIAFVLRRNLINIKSNIDICFDPNGNKNLSSPKRKEEPAHMKTTATLFY